MTNLDGTLLCEAIATLQAQQQQQLEQQRSLQSCLQQLMGTNANNQNLEQGTPTLLSAATTEPPKVTNPTINQQGVAGVDIQNLVSYNPTTSQPIHFQINAPLGTTSNLNPTYGFDSQQLLQNAGTSPNINNPYLPPPVPSQCLTKIKNSEYVEFGSLLASILPNSLNMAAITEGADDEEYCLSTTSTPGAAATFRKKARRNAITNFPTWVMAWNVFYETTLHYYPSKHHELFTYFKHISEYAVSHKFNFVAAYDKAHRIHIAAQRNLPPAAQTSSWTKHCPSLYNLYLKDNMLAQCNNCLGWGHHEKNCMQPQTSSTVSSNNPTAQPVTPFLLQPQAPPQPMQQPSNQFRNVSNTTNPVNTNASRFTCFRYNKGRPCQLPCGFPHICKLCFQQGLRLVHPAFQCPNTNTTTTRFRPQP